jgi:hypothetical protein
VALAPGTRIQDASDRAKPPAKKKTPPKPVPRRSTIADYPEHQARITKVPKAPAISRYPEHQAAETMVSPVDRYSAAKKAFFAEVPFDKKLTPHPGTLEDWMRGYTGTAEAGMRQQQYIQKLRQHTHSTRVHSDWLKQREQEWKDMLSGKTERQQRAAFLAPAAKAQLPGNIFENVARYGEKEYARRVKAFRESERTRLEAEYKRMLKDPEGYYERKARQPTDLFGKVSGAAIGGLEWMGLPRSVSNDLRLISAGFGPGIAQGADAVWSLAKGNPEKAATMIDETIHQYREQYVAHGLKGAFAYAAKHPLLFAFDASILVAPAARVASIGRLTTQIMRANKGMISLADAAALARVESHRPGYIAAHGEFQGGIPHRVLRGKDFDTEVARPVSTSPIGRAGQRLYDVTSRGIERGPWARQPLIKHLGTSSRAAAAVAKEERRARERTEAVLSVLNDPVVNFTTKKGMSRLKKAIGRAALRPGTAEMLVSTLEAGTDVGKALTERVAALQDVLDQGIMWERPRIESPERDKFVETLNERFTPEQASALTKLSDSIARAQDPGQEARWYRKHLAESSNMSAEEFVRSRAAEAAQYQLKVGERTGLVDVGKTATLLSQEEAPQALASMAERFSTGDANWGIYYRDPDGEPGGVITPLYGGDFEKWDYGEAQGERLTADQAQDFLQNETTGQLALGSEGSLRAFEMPVFYSPLQRAIEQLPGNGMKANSLKKALFKLGITKTEWEAMGLDAFWDTQTATVKGGVVAHNDYARIEYSALQEHLSESLNAYNLDEIVRRHDVHPSEDRTLYHESLGGSLIARNPSREEPYYELTMSLPGWIHGERPYGGKGYDHWQQTNVVAHIRFHIITDAEGKRALLIDEIQSDWASEWRGMGRPGREITPEERKRIAEIHREIEILTSEIRPIIAAQNEVYEAERALALAQNARENFDERGGGDPADRQRFLDAERRASDAYYEAMNRADERKGLRRDLEQRRGRLITEERRIEKRYQTPPPPFGEQEVDLAVRRAIRWASEADVDRIIVVPGEMQSFRNVAYGKTPDGEKIDFHNDEREYDDVLEDRAVWREAVARMTPGDLEAYGRAPDIRTSGIAPTFFKLYEQDIPAMLEKALGVKGARKEGIFQGRYADQLQGIPDTARGLTGDHMIGGFTIDLTPAAKAKGLATQRLFQRTPNWSALPRGATELLESGQRALRLFQGANIDTVIHELAHIALPDLDADSLKLVEDHFGGPVAEWTEQQHEAFARGFEHYLYSGKAPTRELQSAFQKLRQWMVQVWHSMRQRPDEFALPEHLNEAFDNIVTPRDRSPLTSDERAHVETQIRELEDSLHTPVDQAELDGALDAMRAMSQMVEDHGREILLFGTDRTPDPDTGLSEHEIESENIDQMFDRRRDAYSDLLRSMGVIDPDDTTTRAGGYFPNMHIARSRGGAPLEPTKLPAAGKTIGVPRIRSGGLNLKRNQFIRFQTGQLGMDPANLLDVLRMRIKHLATLQLRQRLFEHGKPIVRGEHRGGYDRDLMFIRDPKEDAVKMRERTRAALDMDEDSFRALVERGEDPSGDIDLHNPSAYAKEDFDEHVWWVGKDGQKTPPPWLEREDTVRTVPRDIAQKLFGDVFPSAPFGTTIPAVLNALARITMLYAPGFVVPGSRYVARNTIQNAILMGLTHPTYLRKAAYAVRKLGEEHPDLAALIDAESGSTRAEAALPEHYLQASTKAQQREREITELQKSIGGKLSQFADEPFRRSMWIGYAEKYGFHGPEGWRRLLTSGDENVARTRHLIGQKVRDDLIDFDSMSPRERRFASNYLFLYPFVRGSLKWPFMYLREYPFRAGLIGSLAANEGQQREQDVLAKTTSESSRTKLKAGKRQWDYGWMDPWNPAGQTLEGIAAAAQGLGKGDLSAIQQMLSPEYRWVIQALSGSLPKTRAWQSALSSFVPGYSTAEKWRRGGSLEDQFSRHMGLTVEVSPSRYIKRKQAAADLSSAWAWAQQQGMQLDPEAVQKSARAYEKYQDLDQRIGFSQKDLGEGSLNKADLSPAQVLEREQQKAMALSIAVAEGFPEFREQMTKEAGRVRSASLASLQAYNDQLQEFAFAQRNELINGWKAATSE